jgi:hypothetical protein
VAAVNPEQLTTVLGRDTATGKLVTVDSTQRLKHTYIVGKTGTGKSALARDLIGQDMRNGLGLCALDPHGDLINEVLGLVPRGREGDVIILDPLDTEHPFGINLYDAPPNASLAEHSRIASQATGLFKKLWGSDGVAGSGWGAQVAQILRNCAYTLLANPGTTMAEIPLLLTEPTVRATLLANVTNPQVLHFWHAEYDRWRDQADRRQSTLNKVDEFLVQPLVRNIVGQAHTTIDFEQLMQEGRILLVPLPLEELGEDVVMLLGSLIVAQLRSAAFGRSRLPIAQRRLFMLYADEFWFFATPDFARLLTGGRAFRVGCTVIHQERSQLDGPNRKATLNAGVHIYFESDGEDAQEFALQLDATPEAPEPVGWEPVYTLPPNALDHLRHHGHPHPHVQEFIQRYLLPLLDAAAKANDDKRWRPLVTQPYGAGPFPEDLARILEAEGRAAALDQLLEDLNRYLTDSVAGNPDHATWVPTIVAWAAPFLGFGELIERLRATPGLWEHVALQPTNQVLASTAMTVTAGNRLLLPAAAAGGHVLADPVADERRMRVGVRRLRTFALRLRLASDYLAADPPLVDSGVRRPRPGTPRPFHDVREELANRLTHLNDLEAICRVKLDGRVAEHHITLLPRRRLRPDAQAMVHWIQAGNRQDVCRPRARVEQDIEQRHRRLRDGGPPPAPSVPPPRRAPPTPPAPAAPDRSAEQKRFRYR